jgi:hypothetical protein
MNVSKTEHTKLTKQTVHINTTKKLGTKMSDQQDVTYRIGQATQAYGLMHKLWLSKKHITPSSKIRMYNACIKPILMYNTSAMASTQIIMEKLNSTHRKQLRHLLNIFYPVHITNTELYTVTKQRTISIQITEARWKLFGHILRQNSDTITNEVMVRYFENQCDDKIKTTKLPNSLPVQLNRDIKSVNENITLQNNSDLQHLKTIAQDREKWRALTRKIVKKAANNEDAKFEQKRKRRESTKINYEYQGVQRTVTFILRRPANPGLSLENIGHHIKRRRNDQAPPLPNQDTTSPEMQRNRAMEVDIIDIYQDRSI